MRKLLAALLIILIALPAYGKTKAKHKPRPMTEEEKTLYAVGLVFARQLSAFDLTRAELKRVKQGLNDGIAGRPPRVDFVTYSKKSQELGIARRDAHGTKLAAQADAYVEKAAKEEGAVKTKSGAVYLSLKEGEGTSPLESDTVKVHYRGTLIDGREIESTYKTGQPDEGPVNEFFKCLVDGLPLMKPHGKARIICPPSSAYGKEGVGVIPPNATLILEVELLEIVKAVATPPTH